MNDSFKKLRRRDFLELASVVGLGLVFPIAKAATSASKEPQAYVRSASALGTTVTIRVEDSLSPGVLDSIAKDCFSEVGRLEGILSRFVAGTPVASLNRKGSIVSPNPELVDVLKCAQGSSGLSEGAFDITVLPALELFGGPSGDVTIPSESQFERAKALIDYEGLSVSSAEVSLRSAGMGVTLDCVGKGWVLDRVHDLLRESGVRSALVQGGGSFRAVGAKADGTPWAIGVRDPVDPTSIIATVYLRDNAVVTSGDYESYFTSDLEYYHIVDPSTARSPLFSHSATVVAPHAAQADPLGVSSMVKRPADAISLIEGVRDCDCLIATRGEGNVVSSGFGRYL